MHPLLLLQLRRPLAPGPCRRHHPLPVRPSQGGYIKSARSPSFPLPSPLSRHTHTHRSSRAVAATRSASPTDAPRAPECAQMLVNAQALFLFAFGVFHACPWVHRIAYSHDHQCSPAVVAGRRRAEIAGLDGARRLLHAMRGGPSLATEVRGV